MTKLRLLDLFSGIGGFSLGLERSGGFETVAFCEIDPFCRRVLAKHWPKVPICNDIRTMETYRRSENTGNGFIRARSFDREDSGKIRRKPSEHVGRSTSPHDNERQISGGSKEAKNSNKRKTPSDPSPLPIQGGSHHASANQGGEGAGHGLHEMRGNGDGHRPHSCGVAGWSDDAGESSASMPSMSCGEIAWRKEDILDVGPIDIICGGFPCTDISLAGKGAGLAGEQSGLWREYARLIGELRPRFVIVENVAALLGRGLADVLGDLAALGYDAEWHCIPAYEVGLPHARERVWVIAYGNGMRELQPRRGFSDERRWYCNSGEAVDWVLSGGGILRSVDGVPASLDRIGRIGNSVVPQIPELIGRAIMESMQ